MLKASAEICNPVLCSLANSIIAEKKSLVDWNKSYIVNLYKGKGDATERSNYMHRGPKAHRALSESNWEAHRKVNPWHRGSEWYAVWFHARERNEWCNFYCTVCQLQKYIWQKKETFMLPSLTLKRPLTEFHVRYRGGLWDSCSYQNGWLVLFEQCM